MTDFFDDTDDASTPLTPDERNGLLPTYIRTRGELNQVEQRGIFKAEQWACSRRRNVLDKSFLRDLYFLLKVSWLRESNRPAPVSLNPVLVFLISPRSSISNLARYDFNYHQVDQH